MHAISSLQEFGLFQNILVEYAHRMLTPLNWNLNHLQFWFNGRASSCYCTCASVPAIISISLALFAMIPLELTMRFRKAILHWHFISIYFLACIWYESCPLGLRFLSFNHASWFFAIFTQGSLAALSSRTVSSNARSSFCSLVTCGLCF